MLLQEEDEDEEGLDLRMKDGDNLASNTASNTNMLGLIINKFGFSNLQEYQVRDELLKGSVSYKKRRNAIFKSITVALFQKMMIVNKIQPNCTVFFFRDYIFFFTSKNDFLGTYENITSFMGLCCLKLPRNVMPSAS